MEKEKLERFIQHLSEMKDKLGENNKDIINTINEVLKDPYERIKDINDEFPFDNNICITKCDGRCCLEAHPIRITPIDVDWMMKSDFVKKQKLTRKEFVERYLDIYIGPNSGIPIAIINAYKDIICPFLGYHSSDNHTGLICQLGQEYKPTICMLFPLGRFTIIDDNKEMIFTLMECPATETNHMVKIKDHIGNYIEKSNINIEYVSKMIKLRDIMCSKYNKEFIEIVMNFFMKYFYIEDGDTSDKLKSLDIFINEIKSL